MMPRIQFAVVAALALSSLTVAGCRHDEKADTTRKGSQPGLAARPVPVKTRTVEPTSGSPLARFSGSLEPAVKVDLAFRVGGYVETLGEVTAEDGKRRAIDKGDFVKKGTVLARIRAADYTQKVATARATVSEARAEQKLADADLERARKLFEGKAISKSELDVRIARAEQAKSNVEGAIARSGEVGVALDDTVLRAPMDGVILTRSIEVGTLVAPGALAITVADTRTVKAMFGVPQQTVEKLEVGSPVQVYVGGDGESKSPEKMMEAKVSRIAPSADSKGRVFAIEASLPNDSGTLRPGSVVSVHIPNAALSTATMAVPLSAIVRSPKDPRGFSVFVLEGEADRAPARIHDVRLGQVLGNFVTVTEGLAIGQRVVTVGATLLRDGNEAVVIR